MEYLRKTGAKGASAEEISVSLSLPPSIVYSTLKELRRLEFVFTYPRDKMPNKERKRRYVCERGTWGKYGIDRQFLDALTLEGELSMINEELKDPLLGVFGRLYDDFVSKRQLGRFLPTRGGENICPRCARSHEAMEFFMRRF